MFDQDEISAFMTVRILEVILLRYLGKFILRQEFRDGFFAGVAFEGLSEVDECSVLHHLRVIRSFPLGDRCKAERFS